MNPLEEIDENDPGSYANASLIARISTIFAGPLANYLFASVFFFFAFVAGGRDVPDYDDLGSVEVTVVAAERAEAAGLKTGDRIVEVNATPVDRWTDLADNISKYPEQTIPIVVERSGERIPFSVTPKRAEVGKKKIVKGRIGVQMRKHHIDVTAKEAAVLAVKAPPQVVRNFVIGIGELFSGEVEAELSGPVGMVREAAKFVRSSFVDFLGLLGSLSAYLGAFNLIPFPALDGGRLMFLGYEATTRRRPNAKIETQIHLVGLLMMVGLMFYVTIGDLRRPDRSDGPQPAPSSASPPAKATDRPAQPDPASTAAPPPSPSPGGK
jgi:regulator of sigma E protease